MLSKQSVRKIFSQICGDPRRPTILHPQWLFIRQYQRVLREQREQVTGKVLDVGSGDRYFERFFQDRYTRYIALDYPETGELLVENERPEVAGDGRQLPFASEMFDTVLLFEVLEHCPVPTQILCETARALKHGGCLLITAPLTIPEHLRPHDYFRYTQDGLRYLLQDVHLMVERVVPIGSWGSIIAYHFNYSLFEGTFRVQTPLVRYIKLFSTPLILSAWLLTNLFGWILDRYFAKEGFVMGYCVVARKNEADPHGPSHPWDD
jgi:SAM-dependent methyltransferase